MFAQKPTRQIVYALLTAALLASCSPGAAPAPTLDINAINTTIVGTTVAQFFLQFTQTAQAAPTSTSVPTESVVALPTLALPTSSDALPTTINLPTLSFNSTPVPALPPPGATSVGPTVVVPVLGYDCNKAKLAGKTLPNGTVVAAGASFSQVWQMQNTGSCTWSEGYVFTFLPNKSSGRIKGYSIAIKKISEFTKPNHSQSFIVDLVAPTKPGTYKAYWQMKASDGTFFGPVVSLEIVVN